jgi:hypothetical protein
VDRGDRFDLRHGELALGVAQVAPGFDSPPIELDGPGEPERVLPFLFRYPIATSVLWSIAWESSASSAVVSRGLSLASVCGVSESDRSINVAVPSGSTRS